ncbi:MAG: DUF362 domain-containing protein [Treponema sp.]|nr:DUF362 domain-containing protein [Treponema sp.]
MDKNEILVVYGDDISAMAIRLANEANLAGLIGDRRKWIGIKPNLVVARPASGGATTHPEIAWGLISYLKENGFNNIVILEGAWAGASTTDAFKICGFGKVADEWGVQLIDTKQDKTKPCDCRGMEIEICQSALAVDFMINLPVMKGHCQTLITCALKNNKGVIPDWEKRRFHTLGLTKPIAHLNTAVRSDFIVVDAVCGDLDFEEGGNPVHSGRMFAARDPVLCDAWVAAQMGYEISEIPYIGLAEKLGVGSADIANAKVRELNKVSSQARVAASPSGKVRQLAACVNENKACSACYASLIFALSRLNRTELGALWDKICVGQGFKGKKGNLGIGTCTIEFKAFCPGCPPSGADVLAFLRKNI